MKLCLSIFAISVLLSVCPRLAGFDIKLYPASEVYDAELDFFHERLGVNGQTMRVEEFEDDQLESWLQTNLKAGDAKTIDAAWVGRRTSTPADSAEFEVRLPRARVFGIGLGDNDGGNERISINGNTPIELKRFPGHEGNGIGRAFYLLVIAQPNDPDIHSIVIDHGMTLLFDHLLVLENKEPSAQRKLPPRLALRLNDGSRFVGLANIDSIRVLTGKEKVDLPFQRIFSMRRQAGTDSTTILLRNGEKLSGQ